MPLSYICKHSRTSLSQCCHPPAQGSHSCVNRRRAHGGRPQACRDGAVMRLHGEHGRACTGAARCLAGNDTLHHSLTHTPVAWHLVLHAGKVAGHSLHCRTSVIIFAASEQLLATLCRLLYTACGSEEMLHVQEELPLFLAPAACKGEGAHVLCEVPGSSIDLHGDSGVVGRMCRPLQPQASKPHACILPAAEGPPQAAVCMDLKGACLLRARPAAACMHAQGGAACRHIGLASFLALRL